MDFLYPTLTMTGLFVLILLIWCVSPNYLVFFCVSDVGSACVVSDV